MTVKCVMCLLYCSVSVRDFTDYKTRRANDMPFVVSCKNQNSSYPGKLDKGKQNFVRVSREFELSE